MPDVLKAHSTVDWSELGQFDRFEHEVDIAIQEKRRFILLFMCSQHDRDDGISAFPPMTSLLQIIGRLFAMRHKITQAIKFNIIYAPDPDNKRQLDCVFKLYTPANPTHVVSTKEQVAKLINTSFTKSSEDGITGTHPITTPITTLSM